MIFEAERGWIPRIEREELSTGQSVLVATHPTFPGLIAQGDTYPEVVAEFADMVQEALDELARCGMDLPIPNGFETRVDLDTRKHIKGIEVAPQLENDMVAEHVVLSKSG